MKVRLEHGVSNVLKEVKVGFSWTTFFFGVFVPLLRGDWKWALIMLIVSFITFGASWLVFPFFYNKLYIKDLLEKGYTPVNESDKTILQAKGYVR